MSVSRGPPEDIIDAWGDFMDSLDMPSPPFKMLQVCLSHPPCSVLRLCISSGRPVESNWYHSSIIIVAIDHVLHLTCLSICIKTLIRP